MKKIFMIIIILLILSGISFGIYYFINKMNDDTKTSDNLTYNIKFDDNMYEMKGKKSLNEDTYFFQIDEGEKYEYDPDVLELKDGVPTITGKNKKVISKISNVKSIYIITSDYNHQFAFLTKDGVIYIGNNFMDFNEFSYRLATQKQFDDIERIYSKNKYESISLVLVEGNPEWTYDDTKEFHFVGITKDGKKDLIKIKY